MHYLRSKEISNLKFKKKNKTKIWQYLTTCIWEYLQLISNLGNSLADIQARIIEII